ILVVLHPPTFLADTWKPVDSNKGQPDSQGHVHCQDDRRLWLRFALMTVARVQFGAPIGGIFSINGGGQIGFHEEPRSMVSARCLIKSAREGICLAPLTRSRMY